MTPESYFAFWGQLSAVQKQTLQQSAVSHRAAAGTRLHNGSADCIGLLIVTGGRLRTYILSEEGRELTLYRLFERDICLFSASCMLNSLQTEIFVEAELDTDYLQIPAAVYRTLMQQSAAVANYTNELMADRLSTILWLMDQILSKRLDSRLAAFLLDERALSGDCLRITHEEIARHLGSAREVVTRLLKYFQSEGLVELSRGVVCIRNEPGLRYLAADSLR